MASSVRIPFPEKGVNVNYPRSDQNGVQQGYLAQYLPETAWESLNVVPYDRFDRARGGQRNGTAKRFVTQMANSLVQMLQGTAIAVGPQGFTPGSPVLNDVFNGPSNQNLAAYNSNAYATTLSSSTDIQTVFNANAGSTSFTLIASPPGLTRVTGGNQQGAVWKTAISGTAYQVDLVTGSLGFNIEGLGPVVRLGTPATNTQGTNAVAIVYAQTANGVGTVSAIQNNVSIGSAALSSGQAAWSTVHTITAIVTSTTIDVKVDGTDMFTVTNSIGAAQNHAGFYSLQTAGSPAILISNFKITPGVLSGTQVIPRTPLIVAVCGGNVWQGEQVGGENGTWTLTEASNQSSPPLATNVLVQMATYASKGYLVDGVSIVQYDIPTNAVQTYTATAGSAPTDCRFACTWHGRLVLSGNVNDPQNFYMSRIAVPTDWDYTQINDPAGAFEGNASTAGNLGEPITALIPFSDDVLILGGDHTIHKVNGDPLQGGSIDLVTDGIGVLQQNAWCKDPTGTIYFLGTGGLYSMAPASNAPPTILSATSYDIFFRQVDPTVNYLSLSYDIYNHGIWIFISPADGVSNGISVFYDLRNQGFWPIQFPVVQGPAVSALFLGNSANQAAMFIGGFDGYIRTISSANLDDDGTFIRSSLTLGPFQPAGPVGDATVTSVDITTGENAIGDSTSVFNMVWTLTGGKSAYEVTQGTEVVAGYPRRFVAGTITTPASYQPTRNVRLRGGWFAVTLSNSVDNTYWSMEHVVLNFEKAGKQR